MIDMEFWNKRIDMEFWKKGEPRKEWQEDALRLAKAQPYVKGRVAEIVDELNRKYGNMGYDQVRLYLRGQGFKTASRLSHAKRVGKEMLDWEKEALTIANPMMPLQRGDMKTIFKTLSERYPEVRYDSMTLFLRTHGHGTFTKGRKRTKNPVREVATKPAEPQKAFYYGFAKYTNTGQRISKVLKITDDEARDLMEKRFF